MARKNKRIEDYSIEELETLLAKKKLAAREERLQRFQRDGRAVSLPPSSLSAEPAEKSEEGADLEKKSSPRRGTVLSRILFLVETAAVLGLIYIFLSGFGVLQILNSESAAMGEEPTPTPLINAVVLPSGHTPPSSEGGARPNDGEVPANLRPLIQSQVFTGFVTPAPEQAHSIYIPKLWNSAIPIVQGDGWEQLKKGVGQHIGTANPGEVGNLVLSAHNDIFGEFFRDLDKLRPGDEIFIQTATSDYVYRVTGLKIVDPLEVDIMEPTLKATITMISCYPYLVDTERIVVFGELTMES